MKKMIYMHKPMLVAGLLLSLITGLTAQVVTIPAANTQGSGALATVARKPYGCYFGYERTALIYLQSEIGLSGTITSVGFYVDATTSPATVPVNIYIKNTSTASFSTGTTTATELSGATLVYSGTVLSTEIVPGQWTTKTLSTPFNYTGSSNLEIIIEANYGSTGSVSEGSGGKTFRYSPSPGGVSLMEYWVQDNTPSTDNGTTVTDRTNVQLNFQGTLACSGQPTAGNTVASVNPACATDNVVLSISGNNNNSGISYQWISSADSINYTYVSGAASATYSTTQSSATYYRNIVTCAGSGLRDTSTALLVQQTSCYCTVTNNCGSNDRIDTVVFAGINNYTGCGNNGYSFYTSPVALVQRATLVPISVYVADGGQESVGVWIDYDQSGTFETAEFTDLGTQPAGDVFFNGTVSVPFNALLGTTRMRIRAKYGSTVITSADACLSYNYGETEDYLVAINAAPTCTTPVVAGTATGPSNGAVDSVYTYILSGSTGNIQWQFSTSSANGPFSDITGSTDDTLNVVFNGVATFWIRAFVTSAGCTPDSSNTIQVGITKRGNDVCDAIPLSFGTNGPYNTTGANTQPGEPSPAGSGCQTQQGWCADSVITNTLWFKFVAPASGRVRIQSPGFDTQLALWSAANCAAILTGGATLVNANDDDNNASNHGGNFGSSYIDSAICLTPGKTYFVQLDPYSAPGDATTIVLTDLGAGPVATFNNLAPTYCVSAPAVTLTPARAGGSFSGTGVSGTTFSPATAGVGGPYVITYSLYACYQSSDTVSVNSGPAITATTITAVSCFGGSNGAIDVTVTNGSGNYTYNWSNSGATQDISGLTAATYTLSLTDNTSNCSTVSSGFVVTQPTAIVPSLDSIVNVKCNGASTGGIYVSIAGGTPGYTYLWSNGSTNQDLTNVPAGVYTATVTDANGCTFATPQGIPVSQPTPFVVALDSVQNNLCGANNGAVYITVGGGTPGYTYLWSNSATAQDITGLGTATYTVVVSDANACTASGSGTVNNAASFVIASSITPISCYGGNNGAINITVTSGSGSYTYNWSSLQTSEDISGLTAGNYTVSVSDNNSNCSATSNVLVVTEPSALIVTNDSSLNATCFGASTGAVYITVSGGTAPYNALWSNTAQTQDLTNVPAGTYAVTITDANACTAASSAVLLTEPTALVITVDSTDNNICNGGIIGAIYTTVSGGTSPYSSIWSNQATTGDITGLAAGVYTLTVSDVNGCTASASGTVTSPAAIVTTLDSVDNVTCFGGTNGAIYTTVSGGTGNLVVSWSNNANTGDIPNLAPGTYTLTVTDANACSISTSATVSAPAAALAATSVSTNQNQGSTNGVINVTIAGGTQPYTSLWSNQATSEDLNNLSAGVYSVTITDANGCTTSLADTVNLITGIANLQDAFGVSLYPNPTQDKVFIDLSLAKATNISVQIYNMNGQLIRELAENNILTARYEFNFAIEATGVYFAKIKAGDATVTKRIVVAK